MLHQDREQGEFPYPKNGGNVSELGLFSFFPEKKNTLGHGGGSLLSPLVREKEVGMGGGSTTDLLAWFFFCPPSKERVGRGRGVIPGDPSALHASLLPKK